MSSGFRFGGSPCSSHYLFVPLVVESDDDDSTVAARRLPASEGVLMGRTDKEERRDVEQGREGGYNAEDDNVNVASAATISRCLAFGLWRAQNSRTLSSVSLIVISLMVLLFSDEFSLCSFLRPISYTIFTPKPKKKKIIFHQNP